MSEQNPYEAPAANVEAVVSGGRLVGAQSVPIGNGAKWFGEAWGLYKRQPWLWIGIFLVYIGVFIVMSIIPVASNILPTLMAPVLMAGMMLACYEVDEGNPLNIAHLFAGFKRRTGELIGLGAINLGLSLLILVIVGVIMFVIGTATGMASEVMDGLMSGNPEIFNSPQMAKMFILAFLIALLLILPMTMFFWFAPVILMLNEDVGIIESMKLSFMGCVKNILPMTFYSIVGIPLFIVASIPALLGLLVFFPVIIITIYVSYKDIYLTQE